MSSERSTGGADLETLGAEQSAGESFARGDAAAEPQTIGRYRVLHPIGSGGMGVVYAGYDVELDRKVAIKLVKRRGSVRGNARLLREAQALARLSHPHVVQVFEVGTLPGEGGVYVAMELVIGRSLGKWRTEAPRRWRDVLQVLRQAGAGLVAAHDAGLVHRDFKPDNVLVGEDGRVVVIDFGLAREGLDEASASGESSERLSMSAALTVDGGILGTPYYMAPEQHAGHELDARTDQFAFCVTLWESLYGERPFADDSPARAASAILRGELRAPPPHVVVPAWLHEAVARGLSPKPDERWPSMSALLGALAAEGRRRRRALAVGALGLGAAAMAFVAIATTRPQCIDQLDPLAGVWDEARAAEVRERLAAASPSWGPTTAERVGEALDDWATRWRTAERDACEATRVRGDATEALLDLRMACLSERRRALRAIVDVLGQADVRAAEHAIEAVRRLPRPEPCSDEAYVGARIAPPTDPRVAHEVEAIRERLAEALAREDAGDPAASLATSEAALIDAIATGYAPVVAEARLRRASAREKSGDFTSAAADSEDAYHEALASSHDEIALQAAQIRVFVAFRQSEPEVARAWARTVQTAIARAEAGEGARAHLLLPLAMLDADEGDIEQAITLLDEAVTIFEREEGLESENVASALNDLGVVYMTANQPVESERVLARALAIRESLLGLDHPQVGSSLANLATAISMQDRLDDAITMLQRAAVLLERAYGPDHVAVAQTLGNLAYTQKLRGQPEQAIPGLERVAKILERTHGADHPELATALGMLGTTYADVERWPDALDRSERALAILDRLGGTDLYQLAAVLPDYGRALDHLGRRPEARAAFERLIAILAEVPDSASALASAKFLLARVVVDDEPGRALALAREARATLAAERGDYRGTIAEIDAWLATRGRSR